MRNIVPACLFILFFVAMIGCNQPVRVLTIVGGHKFDTTEFFRVTGSLEGIETDSVWHPEALELLASERVDDYQVLLFYDFIPPMPPEDSSIFLALTGKGKPLLFLHHSLGSCQDWDGYREMVGGKYVMSRFETDSTLHSDYKHDIDLHIRIADPGHPVTSGIGDFKIHDEGYSNILVNEDVHPLLFTDHPDCAPLVGWVNEAGNSTCVYLMLGHDRHAYENESFQHLVQNAILWLSNQ